MIVDIDHFKAYNDRYGHPAGDDCLRTVAQVLSDTLKRPADLLARYGGEEFCILLPQTRQPNCERIARVLLSAVEAKAIAHEASPIANHVTLSLGMSSIENIGPAHSRQDLLRCADLALYAAKRGGRAQGWALDYADLGAPHLAREIEWVDVSPGAMTA